MAAPDEETSLLVPPQSPRWRLAAIALGSLAAGLLVLGQPVMPQPWARAALTELSEEEEFSTVYDILVTQDYSAHVSCGGDAGATPTYALCGEASCSPYGDASRSVAACACKEETDESNFYMSGSTIHLADSQTFRSAVVASFGGTLGDDGAAAFCGALGDGTVCRESGLGCDLVSFHSSGYRRRLDVEPAGVTSELLSTTCMGAPCYSGPHKRDSTSLQHECSARAHFGNSTHASRALREMIARPKISRNERKTTEIGAFEVGNFAPFSCPGATTRTTRRRATAR